MGSQHVEYARELFNGWFTWTLGAPVTFPTEYPLRFFLAFLGWFGADGAVLSHAVVFFVPALSFLTMFVLARSVSGSFWGANAAGVFYALDPVIFNKMVSGQENYLLGYALLPLVLWTYDHAIRQRRYLIAGAGFGAVLAITAVQVQLGLLGAVLSIANAIVRHPSIPLSRRLAVLFAGLLTAFLVHLPTVVGVSGGVGGVQSSAQFSGTANYVDWNSVNLIDAVRLMGYVTHYSDQAIAPYAWLWNGAMIVVLIAIAVGIVLDRSRLRVLTLITLAATFAFVTGEHSIVAPLLLWLFIHVPFMTVFRELYHAMALVSLFYACGLALCFRMMEAHARVRPLAVLVAIAILLVSIPMLTGNLAGFLQAHPLRAAYGDVLSEQLSGDSRALWLPMDQPLSFDHNGAGVDPMAVSERGSLWDYTQNWPLTAIDTDIRYGWPLSDNLRALGVGDVINRSGLRSELAGFTFVSDDARWFFDSPIVVRLPVRKNYRQAIDYAVERPLPMLSFPREMALVPGRLSAAAPALVKGYAPVTFGEESALRGPFAFFFDPGDVPEEAAEVGGSVSPIPTTIADARAAFAPAVAWWWHRPEYADAPGASVAFGVQTDIVQATRSYKNAYGILAWVAMPLGNRVQISVGQHSYIVDTHGSGAWRSIVLPLGQLANRSVVSIATLDGVAEVELREFTIMEKSEYDRRRALWQRAYKKATVAASLAPSVAAISGRSGTGLKLGTLKRGVVYRLSMEGPTSPPYVADARGFLVADLGAYRETDFVATGLPVFLAGKPAGVRWSLQELRQGIDLPSPGPPKEAIALWNSAYSEEWRLPGALGHLRSAIGTNVFELRAGARREDVVYARANAFHWAYIVGCLVLLVALLSNVLSYVAAGRQKEI